MNLCFFRIQKTEAKDLFNPAWVYAEAEKVDRLFKKDICCKDLKKIKKFSKLADTNNICVIYNNE